MTASITSTKVSLLLSLALAACADNPYVIGRYHPPQPPPAAPPDAGPDSSAVEDECMNQRAAALVCSGFEAEDLADWPRVAVTSEGELTRSTARARSGASSLHAISHTTRTTAVVAHEFPPVFTGTLHLRAYLYVPAGLPTETMNLFFLGHEPNPTPPEPFVGLDLNLLDGSLQVFSPQSDPARVTGTLAIPRDQWFCFRARILVGDEGALQAYVDEQSALEVAPFDTLPDPGVSLLRAGIDWSSAQASFFEVYIDDLVLDTSPVTCHSSDP